jgi:hypothetical protein
MNFGESSHVEVIDMKTFVVRGLEVKRKWGKFYNKELHNVCSSMKY